MIRPDMQDIPARMQGRPFDHRGYVVPWFVTNKTPEGDWDFRSIDIERKDEAIRNSKCWVSGETLGRAVAFVIGPMCIINRVSSDPPVIPEIGEWSARVCPFMSRPLAKRPDFDGQGDTPGTMVADNPGLCAVWVTRDFAVHRDGLFRFMGDPIKVTWWREGREVSGEVKAQEIYETRAAKLFDMAAQEGVKALAIFAKMKAAADPFSPMGAGCR